MSFTSERDATPRPQPPAIPEIGCTPAEMANAVYNAVNRQLARGGLNAPERLAAAAAVAVITQATRENSTTDSQASTNSIASDSQPSPARPTVDAGPFAAFSYDQCLDFLVSLAKIARAKEMEAISDETMYEE